MRRLVGFACIPLFDRMHDHSSVPASVPTPSRAVAVQSGRTAGVAARRPGRP